MVVTVAKPEVILRREVAQPPQFCLYGKGGISFGFKLVGWDLHPGDSNDRIIADLVDPDDVVASEIISKMTLTSYFELVADGSIQLVA